VEVNPVSGSDVRRLAQSFGLFVGIALLSQLLFPMLAVGLSWALPDRLVNWAFFWPQVTLFIFGLTEERSPSVIVVDPPSAISLAVSLWVVAGLVFGRMTYRFSMDRRVALAVWAVVVFGVALPFLFSALGFSPYLDGP